MKYKRDHGYKGLIPLTNVVIDCQYNPDNDILFITLKDHDNPYPTSINLGLNKKVREQLKDCLTVDYHKE